MKNRILAFLVLFCCCVTACADPQDETALLEGLQQRGLFSLVEYQCRSKINDPASSANQNGMDGSLINAFSQNALRHPSDQREPYWKRARDTAADFVAKHPNDPLVIPVKLQAALVLSANGELLRLESTISKSAGVQREYSRDQLRLATRALSELDIEIRDFLPQVNQEATEDQLSQAELLSIQQNLQYQFARTYRNQANTYADGTNDQIASLQRAITALKKPLTQLADEDPLVANIYLALLACHRELKIRRSKLCYIETPGASAYTGHHAQTTSGKCPAIARHRRPGICLEVAQRTTYF